MKTYVITGSIGNISKPIIEGLVKEGHAVRVITSNSERVTEIEKLGAKGLVGKVQDAAFIQNAFKGADVVYTMVPPIWQTSNVNSKNLAFIFLKFFGCNSVCS